MHAHLLAIVRKCKKVVLDFQAAGLLSRDCEKVGHNIIRENYRYVFVHLCTGTLHVLCVTSEDYRYVSVHLCKGMCSPVSQVRTAGTLHRSQ